jgi:hypothetical protein
MFPIRMALIVVDVIALACVFAFLAMLIVGAV